MARVAVVNTDPEVVRLIEELLQSQGFQTVSFHLDVVRAHRAEFLDKLREMRVEAVICDIPPPFADSVAFARWLVEQRAFPVILTTTNKQALLEHKPPDNVLQIIAKPFPEDMLLAAIVRAVRTPVT